VSSCGGEAKRCWTGAVGCRVGGGRGVRVRASGWGRFGVSGRAQVAGDRAAAAAAAGRAAGAGAGQPGPAGAAWRFEGLRGGDRGGAAPTRPRPRAGHTAGRYTFHDLLRAYATDLTHTTDPDQQRRAATHRILDHYLHTAHTADWLLNPARDPITLTPPQPGVTPEHPTDHRQALEWFTIERPVLLAAVAHAAATGFDAHTWQLAWILWTFLDRRGHWHDQAASGRAAVAAAHRQADPPAQARAHRLLAAADTRLGRLDDAHSQLSHGLDLAAQAGDQAGQAHAHHTCLPMGATRPPHAGTRPRPASPRPVPGLRPPEGARRRPQPGRLVSRPARRPPAGPHLLPAGPPPAPEAR